MGFKDLIQKKTRTLTAAVGLAAALALPATASAQRLDVSFGAIDVTAARLAQGETYLRTRLPFVFDLHMGNAIIQYDAFNQIGNADLERYGGRQMFLASRDGADTRFNLTVANDAHHADALVGIRNLSVPRALGMSGNIDVVAGNTRSEMLAFLVKQKGNFRLTSVSQPSIDYKKGPGFYGELWGEYAIHGKTNLLARVEMNNFNAHTASYHLGIRSYVK